VNRVNFIFDDLDDFYREAEILEPTGNKELFEKFGQRPDKYFVGLSKEDCLKYKYSYEPGMEKLEEIQDDFNLGSSTVTWRWDDQDGDYMDMERAYEGQPFLRRRVRKVGNNTGKFVTVHINLSEPGMVGHKQMSIKAYTAANIINKLQSMGYAVEVRVLDVAKGCGTLNDKRIDVLRLSIPVKKFDEPLNMSLLLTCVSPWMMRKWMFQFEAAKVKMSSGMGGAGRFGEEDNLSNIYIETGECLSKESAKNKIESIVDMFEEHFEKKEHLDSV